VLPGGAEGRIAVGRAASARPDGYMIDIGGVGNHVLNGALYSLRYDVLNDFVPISLLATTRYVLYAKKTIPARDLNELPVAHAEGDHWVVDASAPLTSATEPRSS
jgi:tripartite-type tricarboxylate transporter receptor subunit TctC